MEREKIKELKYKHNICPGSYKEAYIKVLCKVENIRRILLEEYPFGELTENDLKEYMEVWDYEARI